MLTPGMARTLSATRNIKISVPCISCGASIEDHQPNRQWSSKSCTTREILPRCKSISRQWDSRGILSEWDHGSWQHTAQAAGRELMAWIVAGIEHLPRPK